MIANLDVGREKSIAAIDAAEATDKQIILVGQKQPEQENVAADAVEWMHHTLSAKMPDSTIVVPEPGRRYTFEP